MSVSLKHAISPRAIAIAIGAACLVYAFMVVMSVLSGTEMLESIEAKMASQTVPFEKSEYVEDVLAEMKQAEEDMTIETVGDEDLPLVVTAIDEPLPPAPYDGLTEVNQFGALPVIGKNNLTPFKAYQKPFVPDIKKPAIAIGVSGIGMSQNLYEGVFDKLVPSVSIILSPYVDDVDDVQKAARAKGYETWLNLPLETKRFPYEDPGSLGILAKAGLKFNQDNLRRVLSTTSGYAGIAAYTDSAFLDAKPMLSGILSDVMLRGLGVFEMNTARDAMSLNLAIANRSPHVAASVKAEDKSLEQSFADLKNTAPRDRRAAGGIEVSPAMLSSFQEQIAKARQEGFEIVPLSTLADEF